MKAIFWYSFGSQQEQKRRRHSWSDQHLHIQTYMHEDTRAQSWRSSQQGGRPHADGFTVYASTKWENVLWEWVRRHWKQLAHYWSVGAGSVLIFVHVLIVRNVGLSEFSWCWDFLYKLSVDWNIPLVSKTAAQRSSVLKKNNEDRNTVLRSQQFV